MNKLFLLAFVALFALASCGAGWKVKEETPKLWISQYSYALDPFNEKYNAFRPVIYGGSGKYVIKYEDIPAGWDCEDYYTGKVGKNHLLIPKDEQNGRYQVKIHVYDVREKVGITKYLILQFMNGALMIFVRDSYDKHFDFKNYIDFDRRDIILFPSWDKIDQLIKEGDVCELEETIKRVISCQNICDDKRCFLKGLLSRIEKFIATGDELIQKYMRIIAEIKE